MVEANEGNWLIYAFATEFSEPQDVLTRARGSLLTGKYLGVEYDCSYEI